MNTYRLLASILFLAVISIVNAILLLAGGFAGQKGAIVAFIIVFIIGLISNYYTTLNDKRMLFVGGIVLALAALILTLNTVITPGERKHLLNWLLISGMIYLSGLIGGLAAKHKMKQQGFKARNK